MSDPDTAKQHMNVAGGRGRPVGPTRKTLDELVQNRRNASSKWYNNRITPV